MVERGELIMRITSLTVFEICGSLTLLIIILFRYATAVNFDITYDSYAVIVLAFLVGMLARELINDI